MRGRATVFGELGSGNGKEIVLDCASGGCNANCEGRFVLRSRAVLRVDYDDGGRASNDAPRGVFVSDSPPSLMSEELAALRASFGLLCRLPLPATVWLLAIFCVWLESDTVDSLSCGFRACDIASGPAHLGSPGMPMLASTKLARTVTGNVFSLIFSTRAVSVTPKTIRWTLLYILLHVLKAVD